jgi:hypothetical protein
MICKYKIGCRIWYVFKNSTILKPLKEDLAIDGAAFCGLYKSELTLLERLRKWIMGR